MYYLTCLYVHTLRSVLLTTVYSVLCTVPALSQMYPRFRVDCTVYRCSHLHWPSSPVHNIRHKYVPLAHIKLTATSLEYRSGNKDCVHMRHVLYKVLPVFVSSVSGTSSSQILLYSDKVE